MTTLDQKRFDSIVRMLQTACPKDWKLHLRNMGVSASDDLPPADLDRITKHVFWMVRQATIKNPAGWMESDMARAASASVEPETPSKITLDVAIRQNPVKLEPLKFRTDLAKTCSTSPLASPTRIQNPAVSIATDMARVAVRQNPVERKPVKLGTDQTKISHASPVASETRIKNHGARIATDVARVTAPFAAFEPKARPKVARPVAVHQNPVEPGAVKLRTDRAKMSNLSLPELEAAGEAAAQELNWAKLSIAAGKRREAADCLYHAHDDYGASQQNIATAVGKSQGWVSCMIRWRREGFKDGTPFGPESKDARFAADIGRLMPQKPPRGLVRRWMRRSPKDDAHASVSSLLVIGASQPECPELPVADIKGSENIS
jgi:hypothetical protein